MGTISFKYIIPIFILLFTSGLSAQTVSLSSAQCGHTIQYGYPIFCTPNDSATEYEFKFFTLKDTAIISSTRNYLSVDNYYNILHTDKSYYAIVRCRFGENWSSYGDTCITMITIDWFSEKQALYNKDNEIRSRSEVQCHALDLNTVYEIPVVFHVIVPYSYREGNIVDYLPPDKINEQLKIINEFFAGERSINGDIYGNARMHFCFAQKDINGDNLTIDYHGATYYGITYKSTNEGLPEFIEDLSYPELEENERSWCSYYTLFPRDKYLNIFVFENMSRPDYYGEAGSIRLNDRVPFSHIRIRRDVVGENPEMRSEGKNKGYTAVHELGHFFGLKHTFPLYANEIDPNDPHPYDNIPDIEIQYYAPSPAFDTHANEHNVMNYVPDENKRFFTPGQVCRMRETIEACDELSSLCHSPMATECAEPLPNICSARILTPNENIVCSMHDNVITISVDNVIMVKQVSVNGNLIDLAGDNVDIDATNNTIEIQYTYDALGFYEIEVSCGYDNISSNWYTISKIVEAVECETPIENLEQAQWYYDSYASLDFRDGLARFNTDSGMDAFESESSICDSDGNLLFYTDGRRIWNSQHLLLENAVFESQVKSRSTIILKFAESIYAIVSISENDGKLYSCIVEADNNNPLDANTSLTWSPLPLGTDWTGMSVLSAVPTLEPNKYWLLTTKKVVGIDETTTYYKCVAKLAYNNGIVVSDASIDSNTLCGSKVLSIKVSPNAQYVLYSTEFDETLVYRFYTRSGEIESIGNCSPTIGEKGGGVEFSQSGRFLYVAWLDGAKTLKIDQYDMWQLTPCACDIQHSVIFNWEADENLMSGFNLQRAPDGRIYIGRWADLYSNSRMIGVILNPEVRDEDNGRSNVCGVRMHAIDYNESQFLNRLFFTNLVDVTEIDPCKIDFQVCGNWCPGNTLREITLVNLSNTPHNTWWFYDENGNLIETVGSNFFMGNGVPNIPQSVYQHDFVTIKLTSSECPSAEQIRTIGRHDNDDVNIDILGPAKICDDEHPHSYHVNVSGVEPPIYVEWTSPMNYSIENYDLHLTYDPNYVVDNQIPITVNVRDATTWSCPYTASRQVDVTEIDYDFVIDPYCNDDNAGRVSFIINNDPTTNSIPPYNFSDEYDNIHSNESSFTIGNLPLGEYSFDITNDYCHYEKTVEIESSLSDINVSVSPGCKDDTIRIWRDNYASLSGYLFTLNGYMTSYDMTTEQSVLMFVVNRPGDNAPYIINDNCSIDITEPGTCYLHHDLYIPRHPSVTVISNCTEFSTGQVEIMVSNVENPNLLSLYFGDGNNSFDISNVFIDVDGKLHYYIHNIPCDDMYNQNNILQITNSVGNVNCPLYDGPIEICNVKIEPYIKYTCDTTSITLTIVGAEPWRVEWELENGDIVPSRIVHVMDNSYYSELVGVSAGIHHYSVSFGNCIRDGYVEVLEIGEPEYTMEVTNDGNSTEVCVDITSLPPGTNMLIVHDAAGNELINNPIVSGQRYCFNGTAGYHADIITMCDTFPVFFHVYNIDVNLESEACYKSEAAISFEILGGTAPYTATFTSGDIITTQTFNNSGLNVMHAEIIQGATNSLTVVSAEGHSYTQSIAAINNFPNFTVLQNPMANSYSNQTLIVSPNQPLSFSHDVTFTKCTIYCAYNDYNNIDQTQWTVPLGKTVVFDSCTIKSGCPDKMWKGIKIIGSNASAQGNGKGTIVFTNSTIEDADTAFHSILGGIVYAVKSEFKNNKCDIVFGEYVRYFHSLTTIRECSFKTTRLLNNPYVFPEAHISMTGVNGIKIDSCLFANEMAFSTANIPEIGTPYYTDRRGIGISATNSYFYTDKTSTFNGLYYAVHASGLNRYPVSITKSVMNNVFRGIYINDNNGCIVQDNDITCQNSNLVFTPSNNPPSILPSLALNYNKPYGAYLSYCSGFSFDHNTIKKAGTGLYVNNSGSDDNTVNDNIFGTALQGNTNGIVAIGSNSNYVHNGGLGHSGEVGLQALCNVFTANTNDIGIYSGNMRLEQGTGTNPAGNQFYKLSVNASSSHKQFTRQGIVWITYGTDAYTYYHHDDGVAGSDINNYYRGLKGSHYDHVESIPVYQAFVQSYCNCEVPTEPIIIPFHPFLINPITNTLIPSSSGNTITDELISLNSELASKVEELSSKIDDGNTDKALVKAASITVSSNITVDDFCTDGYLSDTVSSTLVSKIEEKPVVVTSVFIENSPLPKKIYEDIMETNISSVLKYVLSYYQSGETKCTRDKKEIARISQEIGAKEKILYLSAMYDTTEAVQYEIVDVFANQESVAGKSKAVDILMSKNDFAEASNIVSNIRSLSTEVAHKYADVAERCINMNINPNATKISLRNEREYLEELIADSSYLYSGKAMSLYKFAFDTILPDYTPMFEDVLAPKSKTTKPLTISNIFTVYPNPTNGIITITIDKDEINNETIEFLEHYGMQNIEDCENVIVSIWDDYGRLLHTQNFNYNDNITLNIENFMPGAYLVEIMSCFAEIFSTIVIKM